MMEKIINNRFVLKKKLGEGGFGSVFLAYDKQINEICAVKMVRPELATKKNVHDRFIKEAKIWLEFGKHPNIVNVRAIDLFNGKLFLALEFIPPNELGVNTLEKQIRITKPSLRNILKWALNICNGMSYAKSKGLIAHRDLKPSNLMIDSTESIKITDFGLAIFSIDPSNQFVDISPSGTPVYMPPEQFIEAARVDERSDIYSFGIILYQMIFGGNLPFTIKHTDSLNYFEYFYKLHLELELNYFDSPLYPLVAKCLSKRPQDRYSSFESISTELKKLYKNLTGMSYRPPSNEEMNAAEHVNYSASYMILGAPQRALKHINQALALAPWYFPAHNNKAAILAELGYMDEAIKIWKELTKKKPELGRPYYNLGIVAMHAGDISTAVKKFKLANELEPDYIPAIINLAICYQKQGLFDKALRLYDKALNMSPDDAQIIYNKAFLLYEIGKYSDAKNLFKKVVSLNSQHVSALNYLGLCYQAMNQLEVALEYFDMALSIDPNYPYAKKNKSILIQLLNNRKGLFGK